MENYFQMNLTLQQINAFSNLGLAHIGDGVYELLCRSYLCAGGKHTVGQLHKETVQLVKAPTQARLVEKLLPHLTEEELSFYLFEEVAGLALPTARELVRLAITHNEGLDILSDTAKQPLWEFVPHIYETRPDSPV